MSNSQEYRKNLVPEYIRNLKVYQPGKPIDELAREKGLTRISKLASNENPLGPSPVALEYIQKNLLELHRYPDMHALNLRIALAKKYNLKIENIILGNGSEGIISYILRAFLRPGDELLTSENTFIGLYISARAVGAELKLVPLDRNFAFDVKNISKNISNKTKIIYLSNPNNPTGTYITKEDFDYLMSHVPEHVLVILDEAYFEFANLNEDYPDSMNYRYDNVLTLRTFSKAYGLAGLRVGYGFAHDELIAHLTKVKLPFEPNHLAQVAALGALNDLNHLERTLENNKIQYKRIFDFLNNHGLSPIPSVTNFITIKTYSGENSDWLFNELLNFGVIIRPLKANEMPDFVRISLGTEKEMDHFIESMEKLIPELKKKMKIL